MVQQLKECPRHWKKGCHPRPCDNPGKPLPQPTLPQPTLPQPTLPQPTLPQPAKPDQVHNIVYLVDEHNITDNVKQKVVRNGLTLQKRYAWHHRVANLSTFNVPEIPDTIELHEKIGNPKVNPNFRWEGFMFGESHMSLQLLSCYCKNPCANACRCPFQTSLEAMRHVESLSWPAPIWPGMRHSQDREEPKGPA